MKKFYLGLIALLLITGCEYSSKSENKISTDNGVTISSNTTKEVNVNGEKIKTNIGTNINKEGLSVNIDNKATTDFSIDKIKELTSQAIEVSQKKLNEVYVEAKKKGLELKEKLSKEIDNKIQEVKAKNGE